MHLKKPLGESMGEVHIKICKLNQYFFSVYHNKSIHKRQK